jgi:hypothetical protein
VTNADGTKTRCRNTFLRHARAAIVTQALPMLDRLCSWVATEDRIAAEDENAELTRLGGGELPRIGRPCSSIYDLLFAEIWRHLHGASFEEMGDHRSGHIPALMNAGWIRQRFHFNRLIAAVNESETFAEGFGERIERMTHQMLLMFGNTSTSFLIDGTAFSTASSDNSRTGRFSGDRETGPVQMMCHAVYDERWGHLVAFRLTWFQRGLGSGEAPNLPYLVERLRKVSNPRRLLGDGAFGSDRNHALCMKYGIDLISPFREDPTRWKPDTKKHLTLSQAQMLKDRLHGDTPTMRYLYTIRNRVEGDNAVVKNVISNFISSRPDRKNMPPFAKDHKTHKSDPNGQERNLAESQDERERIINVQQRVGASPNNEMRIIQFISVMRALIRAQAQYGGAAFDPFNVKPFASNAAIDELMSPYEIDGEAALRLIRGY